MDSSTDGEKEKVSECVHQISARTFRAKRLEKEVAVLKEKIHHLDDMLKSQQRKVRHMIEQVRATCQEAKGKHVISGGCLSRIHWVFDCLFAHLQLQNSRMVIQERDRVIQELEEKVAFLEAEVRRGEGQSGKVERGLAAVYPDFSPPVCAEPRDA